MTEKLLALIALLATPILYGFGEELGSAAFQKTREVVTKSDGE